MTARPIAEERAAAQDLLANFPLPEPVLLALAVGLGLHLVAPRSRVPRTWVNRWVGARLIVAGAALAAWSAAEAGATRMADPDRVLATGPYRLSRNPMYVAWLATSAGVGMAMSSIWMLLSTLAAFLYLEARTIPGEERELERRFGDAYRSYRDRTRRYL